LSRSIHQTQRVIAREIRSDYAKSYKKNERVRHMLKVRSRKQQIKQRIIAQRKQPPHLLVSSFTSPENIPFRISDESKYVHYPASQEDFLGVMRLLPKGLLTKTHYSS
jgi:hypothetical protein